MNVLVYSANAFEIPYLKKANSKKHHLTFCNELLSSITVVKALGYDAISVLSVDDANAETIKKLHEFGVRYITLRSAGYDNVDLKTASKFHVRVANAPEYSPHAIAEHAVALLMALNRNIVHAHDRVSKYNFELKGLIGFDLKGKTVGVVGTGRIGKVFSKIMHGFGSVLLGHDIEESKELIEQFGMQYVSLPRLCNQADIISLHLPLNEETHHLIDKTLIAQMKDGVILINTARGAIIKTEDLIASLRSGKIAGFGMDVYEKEKGVFFKDRSQNIPKDTNLKILIAMPNVLITGHQAFLTEEALTNIARTTIYNLDCWESGHETENELTEIMGQ